ncbi:MAG: metallophosphoesterase [Nanoarchaeota archaeon]|nr:metallophosphoesterase [Nanoarchaeota archaeon]
MKILVFADPHGSVSALAKVEKMAKKNKVDYILCAGDISIFEQGLENLMKKIDAWNIPVLMIHGNHEEKSILEYLCNKTKNIKFIHGQAVRLGDVLILAYGGGGFAEYDPKFEKIAEDWENMIQKKDKVILLTHQPPFKAVDKVLDGHAGSKSFAAFIKKIKPLFCFCGHLHENFDREEKLGSTRVIDPGPYGKVFEI